MTVTETSSFWRRSLYCPCQSMWPKHSSWEIELLRTCATRRKTGDLGALTAILLDIQVHLDFTSYLPKFTNLSEKHNVFYSETSVNNHRLTRHNTQEHKPIKYSSCVPTIYKLYVWVVYKLYVWTAYKLCVLTVYKCMYQLCTKCTNKLCTNVCTNCVQNVRINCTNVCMNCIQIVRMDLYKLYIWTMHKLYVWICTNLCTNVVQLYVWAVHKLYVRIVYKVFVEFVNIFGHTAGIINKITLATRPGYGYRARPIQLTNLHSNERSHYNMFLIQSLLSLNQAPQFYSTRNPHLP
jgi:hypothetical protein